MPMALMADGEEMQAAAQDPQRNDPALMREHESAGGRYMGEEVPSLP